MIEAELVIMIMKKDMSCNKWDDIVVYELS